MKKREVQEYLINKYLEVLNENGSSMAGHLDNNEYTEEIEEVESKILDDLDMSGTYFVISRWRVSNRGFESCLVDPISIGYYEDYLDNGPNDIVKMFLVARNTRSGEYMVSEVNFKA